MSDTVATTVDLTGIPNGDEDALSDAGSEVCDDMADLCLIKDPKIIITSDNESDYDESSSSDTESEEETDSELLSDLDERYEENLLKTCNRAGSTRSTPLTPQPDLRQLKVTSAYQVD